MFPVGTMSIPINPVESKGVLCAIVCVRRSVKWVRCAFASVTVRSVGFPVNRLVYVRLTFSISVAVVLETTGEY